MQTSEFLIRKSEVRILSGVFVTLCLECTYVTRDLLSSPHVTQKCQNSVSRRLKLVIFDELKADSWDFNRDSFMN
jgi:hypothetical protein